MNYTHTHKVDKVYIFTCDFNYDAILIENYLQTHTRAQTHTHTYIVHTI